jgi:hypothetical protein
MRYGISEILAKADALPEEDKKDFFKRNLNTTMLSILKLVYSNPRPEWKLKKENYEYKPNVYFDMEGALMQKFRFIERYFLTTATQPLDDEKTEDMWVAFLENIDAKDAALMEAVRQGGLPYTTINREFVEDVLPEYFEKTSPMKKIQDGGQAIDKELTKVEKPVKKTAPKLKKAKPE